MSEKDKQIIYNALDFKRYHSGEMNDQEMHALEKAAMEDPFLADALDGFPNTNSFEADITEIRSKLFPDKKNKKVIPLFSLLNSQWLKVAAIFILMAATGYFAWQFNNSNKEQPVSKIEKAGQDNSALNSMEERVMRDSNQTIKSETLASSSKTFNNSIIEKGESKEDVVIENNPLKNNNNGYDRSLNYSTEKSAAVPERADQTKESKESDDDAKTIAPSVTWDANTNAKETASYNLKGKVIDDKGNPVPFAVISDKNSNTKVGTDADGKFTFKNSDSVAATTIAAVGYASSDEKLRSGREETIVLKPSSQELSEVVVTGISRSKKKPASAAGSAVKRENLTQASVVGGMQLYKKYIKDSMRILEIDETEYEAGPVILSFRIKRDGTPYKIRVQQSLCDACDREAIRLLLNGPKWIYLNDNRTMVSIDFNKK